MAFWSNIGSKRVQKDPKGGRGGQEGAKREPKGDQREPKGSQKEPGNHKEAKGRQKGGQREPRGGQNISKKSIKSKLYLENVSGDRKLRLRCWYPFGVLLVLF